MQSLYEVAQYDSTLRVLRPSLRRMPKQALLGMVGFITLLVVRELLRTRHFTPFGLAAGAGAVAALLLFIAFILWLNTSRSRIVVGHGQVEVRDGLGRTRHYALSDVGRLIAVSLAGRYGDQPRAYVIGKSGRRLFRVAPTYDLEALAQALGVKLEGGWWAKVSARQLGRDFPGTVSWAEMHPVKLTLIVAAALVALIPLLLAGVFLAAVLVALLHGA